MGEQNKPGNRPRVRFEKVPKETPPAKKPSPPPTTPPPPAPPTLRVLGEHEKPRYSGLHRDEQGIVVGAQGLVLVYEHRWRSPLLAAISQVCPLSEGVQVEQQQVVSCPDPTPVTLLTLTPPDSTDAPSNFYERVRGAMAAARVGSHRAHLCVGDGQVFVPFAPPTDPVAPSGYDVAGDGPQQGRVVLLPEGPCVLPPPQPVSLLDALCDVPLEAGSTPPPTMLAVLTDRRLAALVAGYVQRHGLAYSVRFLTWQGNNRACEVAWFDLVQAREVRPIPAFIINFLQRLTRTTLLTDVAIRPDDAPDLEHEPPCRVLVARGQRTPLYLPHIEGILPSNSALLLAGRPWGAGLVHPLPPRQQMQQLTRVRMPTPARVAVSDRPAGQLQLPLVLVRDGTTAVPVHGLLLDTPALERLRRLVRRLPAPWFAQARIATGEGVALVLAPDATQPIRGIPVGQPLSRADQPGLLLPRGMLLRPSLPPDLLAPVLDLQNDTLTVLTPTCRYDAPLEAFQPVSTLLALDMPASLVRIAVQPATLPTIDLSDLLEDTPTPTPAPSPPREKAEKEEEPTPKEGLRSIVHGLLGRGGQGSTASAPNLHRHAGRLQKEGHYAAAAVFYDYLGETGKAKTCYQQAVEQGKQKTS